MMTTETDIRLQEMRVDSAGSRIPKRRYIDAEFSALEHERLWKHVWQWACLVDDVPDVGSYYEHQIGDQSYLVVRGSTGELNAFHNVCLHRGNRLRAGSGTAKDLTCPYHRWSWSVDGDLRVVPDRETFPPFEDACFGLNKVSVDVWEGFVFINPDPDAPPLIEYLAPLVDRLAPYHFGEHTCTRSITMPLAANWKTIVDGFVDVYHLQGVHPQLLKFLDDVNTTYEVLGQHSAMYMPMAQASPRLGVTDEQTIVDELAKPAAGFHGKLLRQSPHFIAGLPDGSGARMANGVTVRQALLEVGRQEQRDHGFDFSKLSDVQMVDDHHYFFFPNLVCNVYAGHFIAARIRPDSAHHERCFFDMFIFNWLTPQDKADRPPRRHGMAQEDSEVGRVPDQDFTALPKVQLGMHSDGLESIFLNSQEIRVKHFHEVIDTYIFGGA